MTEGAEELSCLFSGLPGAPLLGPTTPNCGRILGAHGVARLLDSLHLKIRWRPPFFELDVPPAHPAAGRPEQVHIVRGRPLVLAPSVFYLDRPWVLSNVADPTAPDLLVYPILHSLDDAVGLWSGGAPPERREPALLLGATRADALKAIAETCTTTELARRLGVSPATASHHIGLLREAKLITSIRDGNAVRQPPHRPPCRAARRHPPPPPSDAGFHQNRNAIARRPPGGMTCGRTASANRRTCPAVLEVGEGSVPVVAAGIDGCRGADGGGDA